MQNYLIIIRNSRIKIKIISKICIYSKFLIFNIYIILVNKTSITIYKIFMATDFR